MQITFKVMVTVRMAGLYAMRSIPRAGGFWYEQVVFSYLLGQKPPARVHARGGDTQAQWQRYEKDHQSRGKIGFKESA